MLPKVPRIITSWLPRREPKLLKSRLLDAVFQQIFRGRVFCGNHAGRGNMVGGDEVAEVAEHRRIGNVGQLARRLLAPFEEGGLADVGR